LYAIRVFIDRLQHTDGLEAKLDIATNLALWVRGAGGFSNRPRI
jgi:hypothetical protein